MIKELIIFTAILCSQGENGVCMKPQYNNTKEAQQTIVFTTAMTRWQKLETKTIYHSNKNKER